MGHFGIGNTLNAMSLGGQQWQGMRKDVIKWIEECSICQKIKLREGPMWRDEIEHHLYHLDPLASLSIDTLGPLPEDENGFSFIVVIVDNFSKFVGLYPAISTTSKDFIGASYRKNYLLCWDISI